MSALNVASEHAKEPIVGKAVWMTHATASSGFGAWRNPFTTA